MIFNRKIVLASNSCSASFLELYSVLLGLNRQVKPASIAGYIQMES